jgi:hypothetical protein
MQAVQSLVCVDVRTRPLVVLVFSVRMLVNAFTTKTLNLLATKERSIQSIPTHQYQVVVINT